MIIGVVQMLTCNTLMLKKKKTECTNICSSVVKSCYHVHEGQGHVTPGQSSLNCGRREEVKAKVQRLKTRQIS